MVQEERKGGKKGYYLQLPWNGDALSQQHFNVNSISGGTFCFPWKTVWPPRIAPFSGSGDAYPPWFLPSHGRTLCLFLLGSSLLSRDPSSAGSIRDGWSQFAFLTIHVPHGKSYISLPNGSTWLATCSLLLALPSWTALASLKHAPASVLIVWLPRYMPGAYPRMFLSSALIVAVRRLTSSYL